MTIFKSLHTAITQLVTQLQQSGALTLNTAALPSFVVESPRDPSHGDVATNIAMMLAKAAGKPPRALAELLQPEIAQLPQVASVAIAGPGFINLRLKPAIWQDEVREILSQGLGYGDSTYGQSEKVNIEFVSANPTGPMHAGHVRGAVLGDTLSKLLAKAGYDVTREYYFNDAGAQVDVLARTAFLRYREALGESIGDIPEGLYPGEYLKEVGEALAKRDGKKWLDQPESAWLEPIRDFAVQYIMRIIRDDLALIGIQHDVFTNERVLIENGTLETAFKILDDRGLIYVGTLPPPKGKEMDNWEPVPLTLFRSSQFGDSSDRPLKNREGRWTYIMPDIAYHYDMVQRGFKLLINVLGTDHGGYEQRLGPAIAAFSDNQVRLKVLYNNIVKILKNGEPVKLSKRSGNLITLREMVEQVGAGAVRFFMLTRAPESELEFDFAKVVEQTRDNPVFYVQYAYARCCSVFRHAATLWPNEDFSTATLASTDISAIDAPEDVALIRVLANWTRVIEAAATAQEPHRIAFYLMELAAEFHSFWNKGNDKAELRFILPDDYATTRTRLVLLKAVQLVIASGLAVMGCEALEEMRHEQPAAA
jgi:arginyl-tRNA synthetase